MEEFTIKTMRKGVLEEATDRVTEEVPLTIEVQGRELATLLCSPQDLKNLVVGFLFTSGFIEEAAAVKSVVIDQDRWKAYVDTSLNFPPEELFKRIYTSGCGKGVIFHNPLDLMQRIHLDDGFTASGEQIAVHMKTFLTSSAEYRETGGVHSCCLVGADGTMIMRDDIGRHNAMDKVIGEGLQKKIDFSQHSMFTSGRVSSEILSKVLRCRIPVLVSASAPTNQAVKLARDANLTLLGFVRGKRMNIYSGEQRMICAGAQS